MTTADHDAPMAQTLDESALRALFSNAPEQLDVPRDVSSIFRSRMRRVGGDRHQALIVGSVIVPVLGIALLALGQVLAGLVATITVMVAWIIVAIVQHSRSSADFFAGYARARGLDHDNKSPYIPASVPLFGRGDKRKFEHVMAGTIAGQSARLGHYQWTDITTDSEGNRSETDHDFTVIAFPLPPAVGERFAGVYLTPHTWSFGALQDKFAHDHKVELESSEFAKRYSLRVRDDQDNIALYELFSTTFVHLLATDLEVFWEQVGNDLVVWQKGHESECADLDALCQRGAVVLQRYLEEDR